MKPIILNEETKKALLLKFIEKFDKELDDFEFGMNESKFSMSVDMSEVAKEKITILYTPEAYLKMQALVDYYDTEVGWYGLVQKLNDKTYRVYDVKLCKQYVDGGKVDTEDEDTLEFFNSLTDDEAEHMHFQAHSHVKMSTSASGIDLQNQADVVHNMGGSGFYIFQIWNKNNDVNTYMYDIDNNVFYDRKDINLEIEYEAQTINDWVEATEDLVCEKKAVYPYQYGVAKQSTGKKGKEPKQTNPYYPYYGGYYGGCDW